MSFRARLRPAAFFCDSLAVSAASDVADNVLDNVAVRSPKNPEKADFNIS
jgi:hypothetical protein